VCESSEDTGLMSESENRYLQRPHSHLTSPFQRYGDAKVENRQFVPTT